MEDLVISGGTEMMSYVTQYQMDLAAAGVKRAAWAAMPGCKGCIRNPTRALPPMRLRRLKGLPARISMRFRWKASAAPGERLRRIFREIADPGL